MRYFTAKELVDRETYEQMGETALTLFNPEALIALDDLREFLNAPITVNNWHNGGALQWRGWRTKQKATELGAPNSQHAKGNAFDCTISRLPASTVRAMILAHQDNELLRRITRIEGGVSWLHFDLKPVERRIHVFKV